MASLESGLVTSNLDTAETLNVPGVKTAPKKRAPTYTRSMHLQ